MPARRPPVPRPAARGREPAGAGEHGRGGPAAAVHGHRACRQGGDDEQREHRPRTAPGVVHRPAGARAAGTLRRRVRPDPVCPQYRKPVCQAEHHEREQQDPPDRPSLTLRQAIAALAQPDQPEHEQDQAGDEEDPLGDHQGPVQHVAAHAQDRVVARCGERPTGAQPHRRGGDEQQYACRAAGVHAAACPSSRHGHLQALVQGPSARDARGRRGLSPWRVLAPAPSLPAGRLTSHNHKQVTAHVQQGRGVVSKWQKTTRELGLNRAERVAGRRARATDRRNLTG